MIILSHRGYWHSNHEKNTRVAFERSFSLGFGTETDVRDFDGKLVISHDPAHRDAMPIEEFLEIYRRFSTQLTLALNVKADGLQHELKRQLEAYEVQNYFVFDMAVPDSLGYLRQGMPAYTRHSEYEPTPPYYERAQGVWMDEFNGHWIEEQTISAHLVAGKAVCIVSPELHGRTFEEEWAHYRDIEAKLGVTNIMLCTDFPERAKEFFDA